VCRLYLAGKDPGYCHGSPLTSAFEQAEKRPGEALDANFAFFWDVGSLFQPPRTERETALIEAGMHTSTVWYGHAKTPVWMQSELPPGVVGRSCQDSGWCFLEAAISAAVKPSDLRIDLAMRPRGQFGLGREDRRYTFSGIPLDSMPSQQVKVYGGVDYAQPGTLVSTCKARRLPPLTPDEMHRQLIDEKQFTEDSDRVTVSAIYRAFFETVTRPCTSLSFNHSGWGTASLGLLCLSLPQPASACLDLKRSPVGLGHQQARTAGWRHPRWLPQHRPSAQPPRISTSTPASCAASSSGGASIVQRESKRLPTRSA
jgi:hypothetical protein